MSSSSSEISSPLLTLSNNLADAVEKVGRAIVAVNGRSRISSSGVHWQQNLVVTADHTIRRSEDITVTLPDDRTVPATVVGRDSSTDLAVLKLQGVDLPTAEIGDTESLKVGHMVLAIGLRSESGLGASFGVVSALGGAWRSWGGGLIDRFVRLDLTLYPGLDGGPLVDAAGRVVGINTSGPRGMVLAIPTATVNRVVNQLQEKGRIARGYLGLGMQPVAIPDNLKRSLSLTSESGLIIVNVEPKGPSDQAGVLIGDVLIALDGTPIRNMGDVQSKLGPESIGRTINVQLIRGGTLVEVAIAPVERPRGSKMPINLLNSSTSIAQELASVAERLRRSTVEVLCRRSSSGSGVIWNSDGLIITNAHVATEERAKVELSDGRVLEAVRTSIDPWQDLAALRVEATDLPGATIGDSDTLRVGELVLAVGNPLGVVGALTTGIIHSIGSKAELQGRNLHTPSFIPVPSPQSPVPSPQSPTKWVMADIRLAPGNSGGPLTDAQGRVIGINTMIAGGLALAVPSNAVERFLREKVARPYLGVTMRPVPVLLGNRRVLGLSILDIAFGSLVFAAGLVKGDVLIGVFGQYFHTPDDLTSVLWQAEAGDLLPLEFLRSGKRHYCTVLVQGDKS